MKPAHFILTIVVCAMTGGQTAAQHAYTLDECVAMALENNVAVRNADCAVESAGQQRRQAFTAYFPEVGASAFGFSADKGLIRMDLAPGMSMSMLKNGVTAGVTATQPVFAGGRIVNTNRLASLGVEVSTVRRRQSADEVRLTAERYYWQTVTLQEKLLTLRALEAQLGRIGADVEAAVAAGVATRNDLLQVQLQQNDIESSRISLENGLRLSRRVLAQYIGAGTDSIAVAATIDTATAPPMPREIYIDPSEALEATVAYRLLQSNVRCAELEQRIATGKNLPSVGIGAGYMYDNLSDRSKPVAMAFVSVSVPLSGWWGGSHEIKRRRAETVAARNTLEDSSELLVIGMQKAWDDLGEAHRQMLVAQKSIEQSAENLRLHEAYYRAGTTTMSDLLDAQTLYRRSCDRFTDAYASFRVSTTEYLIATAR